MSFSITGNIVDIHNHRIYPAEIIVKDDRITAINELPTSINGPYILPGFIDAHVHIESSMLIPSEFARLAVPHGTVATVSDPHEIANVCGLKGVNYMIENGKTVPFKFYFGAPSCVPATTFETAGATIGVSDINNLMKREDIWYLSEMMNFPGVLNGDKEVLQKIAAAKKNYKPVDGHAPGLIGDLAKQYINAGISTDHECFTREEALDKLGYGMQIIIREGSAAKNFEALIDLLNDYPDKIMFCSDDKHPDSLVEGHINVLCARAVAKGIDVYKILQAACVNPVQHYKLKVGLLRKNDFADFIVVKDLQQFDVWQTYINGQLVAENGKTLIERQPATIINQFHCSKKTVDDFKIHSSLTTHYSLPVIEALDGQLITNKINAAPKKSNGNIVSDVANDILKIVVVNRYADAPIAKAFIKNFGLKKGAIASSVAHDSHNIVAVGVEDESICEAVNMIIEHKGGISVAPPPPKGGILEDPYEYETDDPMLYALLKKFVQKHRSAPTEAENILWEQLRSKKLEGYKFRRQHIVGAFIADFLCLSKKLIIEVDGLIHQLPENKLSDEERTQWLTKKGYTVVRFSNREVIYETEKVLQRILQTLNNLPDNSTASKIPPLGGGGALPLPVAGLMSTDDGYKVAEQYAAMDAAAKALGCTLSAPYMTLSFMALLVIPHLKLSDKGLFDGDSFQLLK